MGEAIITRRGGGRDSVRGTVQEGVYLDEEPIIKGDFVTAYSSRDLRQSPVFSTGYSPTCVPIDNDRFIIFEQDSQYVYNGQQANVSVGIGKVSSSGEIELGVPYKYNPSSSDGYYSRYKNPSALYLGSNRFLLFYYNEVYNYDASPRDYRHGRLALFEIDGTNNLAKPILVKTSSNMDGVMYAQLAKTSDTQVLVVTSPYVSSSSTPFTQTVRLYTITENDITLSASTVLPDYTTAISYLKPSPFGTALIQQGSSSGAIIYSNITVNGSTISIARHQGAGGLAGGNVATVINFSDTKMLISWKSGSTYRTTGVNISSDGFTATNLGSSPLPMAYRVVDLDTAIVIEETLGSLYRKTLKYDGTALTYEDNEDTREVLYIHSLYRPDYYNFYGLEFVGYSLFPTSSHHSAAVFIGGIAHRVRYGESSYTSTRYFYKGVLSVDGFALRKPKLGDEFIGVANQNASGLEACAIITL